MKSIRRGIATLLAALLLIPDVPVYAQDEELTQPSGDIWCAQPAQDELPKVVQYNTGNGIRTVRKAMENSEDPEIKDREIPDALAEDANPVTGSAIDAQVEVFGKDISDDLEFFEEDGSYTIRIPEADPFFPYEVQFTYDGNVTKEWFMTPEDSVEIGGHTFYVSAEFTGTVVTQMSFNVAGNTVIVYPEGKEFPEYGAVGYSLLPLEERSFWVDLTGYTRMELSMVKIGTIFAGQREFTDTDKIMWSYYDDDYMVSVPGDVIDMSQHYNYYGERFLMIVGSDDQLDASNIRYRISVYYANRNDWLIPSVYKQEEDGKRAEITIIRSYNYSNAGYVDVVIPWTEVEDADEVYVGLKLNPEVFPNPNFDQIKVYEGVFDSLEEAMAGKEITDQVWEADPGQSESGYAIRLERYSWSDTIVGGGYVTFVTFDAKGNPTGFCGGGVDIETSKQRIDLGGVIPVIYTQDMGGERQEVELKNFYVTDRNRFQIEIWGDVKNVDEVYVGLQPSNYASNGGFGRLEVYEGKFETLEDAVKGKKITEQIWKPDMDEVDAGYKVQLNSYFLWTGPGWGAYFWAEKNPDFHDPDITFVAFDAEGDPMEFLTITLSPSVYSGDCGPGYLRDEAGNEVMENTFYTDYEDGVWIVKWQLYQEYRADAEYFQKLRGYDILDDILGAYVGIYASIADAQADGAKNIQDELFGSIGYKGNYSRTVYFTTFVKVSETAGGEPIILTWHLGILAEEGDGSGLSSDAWLAFRGLQNASGERVACYLVDDRGDSYAARNYLTMLVDRDVDLSGLAPVFIVGKHEKLYAAGGVVPEVSGKSIHDFSRGPVQYTVLAEDGKTSKNYWLQIIQPAEEGKFLYVNSLADPASKTEGIHSNREIMMDTAHDEIHDILLINMGADVIAGAAVELVSDVVELDEYWTLKGKFDLEKFDSTLGKLGTYDELGNMAKLRLKRKEGVPEGTAISGTLTIKSDTEDLLVLTLTGMIGVPCITTTEIPEAVKYVPYGTVIQNSNKYDWNRVSYSLCSGKLPEGMILKPSGELYGVPKETGKFTFQIQLENNGSRYDFAPDLQTFTLEVKENTNENVDDATDIGYDVTTRIQNLYVGEKRQDQLFVSAGTFSELVDVYLDGEKLEKDKDYTAESGSTRITIMAETLDEDLDEGTHTLGVEFRAEEDDSLKRAAQNFDVVKRSSTGSSTGGSSQGGISGGLPAVTTTPTPEPTAAVTPTAQPAVTLAPTATPQPTATITPMPTATPQPTATVTPTPTSIAAPEKEPDVGEPFVKNDKSVAGWDAIKEQIADADDGDTVVVDMNNATVVPGEVIEAITDRDITIRLELNQDIAWEINGNSVVSDEIKDIDFEVLTGEDANEIPVEIVNHITGEHYFANLTLTYSGEFGFTAVLYINLGKKNADLYANLFYYDQAAGELEFICADRIDKAGNARLSFTHASDYTVVIDNRVMDGSDREEKGDKEDGSLGAGDKDLPKTALKDSVWFLFAGMLIILLGGTILLIAYDKKRQSER